MSSYSINDKHDIPNFNSFNIPPSESTEEQIDSNLTKIIKINFPLNSSENEFENRQEKPLKPPIFDIAKKDKSKQKEKLVDIEGITNIWSNRMIPDYNPISNLSKEETKEISNINNIDKQENKIINNKRKRKKTNLDNDEEKKRDRPDNCRLKIVRHFFNSFLIKSILNSSIQNKNNGPHLNFEKFPQELIYDVVGKKIKNLLNKNLEYFLSNKELYINCHKKGKKDKKLSSSYEKNAKKPLEIYEHNLDVLKKLKSNFDNNNILKKYGLENYLTKRYEELYKEYSKSYRFQKLKELKDSKADDYDEFQRLSEYDTFIGFFKKELK